MNSAKSAFDGILRTEEILCIIQSCRDAGARRFRGRGIDVSFGISFNPPAVGDKPVAPGKPAFRNSSDLRPLEEKEARMRQEQVELMKIEDPEAYEDLVMRGELLDLEASRGEEQEG